MSVLTARGVQLGEFWQTVRTLSREAFLSGYPHPFLIELTNADEPADQRSLDFNTVFDLTASKLGRAGDDDEVVSAASRVWAITKYVATFPGKVTVGRTSNNDIVLSDGRVSKLHAWFLQDGDDRWVLCDAESSNGTFHNAERLESLGKAAVTNRDQLGFGGRIKFVFVTPGHFQRQARFLLRGDSA